MRLFASHAGIEHFRVEWNNKPLLLFADMEAKEYSSAWSYQNAKAVITTRQNVTMGLKKGNTVLQHFQYHGQLYQAILQMSSSVPGGKGGTDTPMLPCSLGFAKKKKEVLEGICEKKVPSMSGRGMSKLEGARMSAMVLVKLWRKPLKMCLVVSEAGASGELNPATRNVWKRRSSSSRRAFRSKVRLDHECG